MAVELNMRADLELDQMPIGSEKRDSYELWAVEFADDMLVLHENIEKALDAMQMKLNCAKGSEVLRDHVEQVWIARLLR